ncbi:MAG: glutamine amidotransferase [Chromatiales bacterium]|nr:glutamine amidotransferase [Chromatiales bacterium]
MNRKPLVVLKTGSKIATLAQMAGDYEDWIADGMGWERSEVQVIDAVNATTLPEPSHIAGIVITGSGAMVSDEAPWMRRAADWLARNVDAAVPVLGICFGHQLLAYAFGGRVDYNPRGVEVGSVDIELFRAAVDDPLFSALPGRFPAQVSHRQSVLALPAGATALGRSAMEPHQAIAFAPRAWGVQFHPEFDERVIARFVAYYRDVLAADGRSADALIDAIRPAPESRRVLSRFAAILREGH